MKSRPSIWLTLLSGISIYVAFWLMLVLATKNETRNAGNWRLVDSIDIRRLLVADEYSRLSPAVRELYMDIISHKRASHIPVPRHYVLIASDDTYESQIETSPVTVYVFCMVDGELVDEVRGSLLMMIAIDNNKKCIHAGIDFSESRCSDVREWENERKTRKQGGSSLNEN